MPGAPACARCGNTNLAGLRQDTENVWLCCWEAGCEHRAAIRARRRAEAEAYLAGQVDEALAGLDFPTADLCPDCGKPMADHLAFQVRTATEDLPVRAIRVRADNLNIGQITALKRMNETEQEPGRTLPLLVYMPVGVLYLGIDLEPTDEVRAALEDLFDGDVLVDP